MLRNLDQLPAAGAILVAAWPNIKGATGLPVRAFAIAEWGFWTDWIFKNKRDAFPERKSFWLSEKASLFHVFRIFRPVWIRSFACSSGQKVKSVHRTHRDRSRSTPFDRYPHKWHELFCNSISSIIRNLQTHQRLWLAGIRICWGESERNNNL